MTSSTISQRLDASDPRRYRRTLRFFGRLVASVVWWELVAPRLLGSTMAGRGRKARLRRYARQFRAMALDMGGVMIKLGQFFSARVDILPVEITHELTGLQDEVPPADFGAIRPVIEAELGSIADRFAWFDENAHAAASLGQVYRARLADGARVVVKVQRPGIRELVATDLAALGVVGGWLMRFRAIRRRANVPQLLDEFARTLWEELDYVAEAANARRFGEMFTRDPEVYIPAVYGDLSTRRVLTLEDVTCIKITDHDAIDAAGVDRHEVAQRLFRLYMTQIFEHRFFHADPHPGNLFVYPLPHCGDEARPDQAPSASRPFYLVFIDFGMVGAISDNVLAGFREVLLAVGTRNMRRMVAAYQILGVLLPDADVERIAEVEQMIFDRVSGMTMRQLADVGYQEMRQFAHEFRDLLYAMPFQVPQNLIYVGRAVGILSGMCTSLDPDFNPWTAIAPYAKRLVEEELRTAAGSVGERVVRLLRFVLEVPRLMEGVLRQLEQGELHVRVSSEQEGTVRRQQSWHAALHELALALVVAVFVGAGTVLVLNGHPTYGGGGYALAGLCLLVFLWRARKL